MTHELLDSVQNINGGGLSVSVTGKYTSVRHERAKIEGKLTAGEAAKIISKELKIKLSAAELIEVYKLLHNGRLPEWHHSGFYKKGRKSTMGKTYFFDESDICYIADNYDQVQVKKDEQAAALKAAAEKQVKGFYYVWDYDYGGNYGKKRNFKVLQAYEGSELNKPRQNFTTCTDEQFLKVTSANGKKYFGWDEPNILEFN